MKSNIKKAITALSVVTLAASSAHATTIFSHTFDVDPGTGDLNGTAVDTGTGNWVAAGMFDQNGNINITDIGTGRGTATVNFTPVDGFIYTLEASLGALTGDNNWVGFGFAEGNSSSESNDRFITGGVVGKSWMFNRGSGASDPNRTFLGDSTAGGNPGIDDPADWSTASTTYGGNLDMRIELDTTGGTGNWTSTWFVDTGSGFFEVRAATPMLDETIDSVGFSVSNNTISGNINSFSLTSNVVPEPSSTALLGLGSLALILRRRR